ncbi:TetR family transcriptional regulator [Martelella alba]|uniref:TetR family transcriptional regulator n=1 Tax=Martelella alba TaxID=2590451 RepID=UPI001F200765|nr:TetR family transcriptional regulator [Martelella alba]
MAKPLNENDKSRQGWKQNPEAVKRDIIRVAMTEFAQNGLSGARVDRIAASMKTSKRMIYYYFGDKEGLYAQVLEYAYAKVREGEKKLSLDDLPPLEAIAKLVGFTFDHHRNNPDFLRMVMIENIHHADYLRRSEIIPKMNSAAVERLEKLIARGEADGVFRSGLDPLRLHWQISAFSVFNVANADTFGANFGSALFTAKGQAALRREVIETILAYVRKPREEETP